MAIGRGVCMRLLGEGELCKFKLKVNRWRFGELMQIARGGRKLTSKFEGFVGGVFYKV